MRFDVLGPLRVRDGASVDLAIGGRARRRLLAVLVSRAGQPVPPVALIEALWGELAPRSAAKTLQSHIVRLRDDLGRDGDGVLLTDRGGYRLAVVTDQVDVLEFESLVGRARGASNGHEPIELLDRALRLWRSDDAYADFGDAAFAVAERMRLTELRAEAKELFADHALVAGRAAELVPELEARVRAQPYRERGWEQLMLALYRSGRQADALAAYRRVRDLLAADLGVDPGPALRDLEDRILRHEEAAPLANLPAPVAAVRRTDCPYRGLAGYSDRDSDVFVGRERLTAELAGLLATVGTVIVTGQSGCGKSSLLRAGLLPALRAGALPGSGSWRSVLCAVHEVESVQPADLLVVDQAEELFTLLAPARRTAVIDRLVEQVSRGGRLIVAIRGDFVGNLAELDRFAAAARSTLLVRPMRSDEIRRAIEEPAARFGVEIEAGFADGVLDELGEQRAALPLLSAALVRSWERRGPDGLLTLAAYRSAGGIAGALDATAEDVFALLDAEQQGGAQRLLVRLVARNGEQWIRRPVRRADLTDPAQAAVASHLAQSRLLVVGDDYVEIVHDALLTQWHRLRGWLAERAVGSELLEHLVGAARGWQAAGRPDVDLYRGPRLAAALEWQQRFPDDLSEVEQAFLAASELAASVELRAAQEQVEREARSRRRLRLAVVVLVPLVLLAVTGVFVSVRQTEAAHREAGRARSAALAADARRLAASALTAPDLRTSLLLAVAAYRLQPSVDSRGALLSTLERSGGARFRISTSNRLLWVGTSPGSTTVLAADNNSTILRYDISSHRLIGSFPMHADHVDALSSDGRKLVVSGAFPDGTGTDHATVLDAATGHTLGILSVTPTAVAFAADGRRLAVVPAAGKTGSRSAGKVLLYDVADLAHAPREVRFGAPVSGLAAGGSAVIATTTQGSVVSIDARRGRVITSSRLPAMPRSTADVSTAVSQDGRRLAFVGRGAGDVFVVDMRRLGAPPVRLQLPPDQYQPLSFSRDGRLIAAGGVSGTVAVANARTGSLVHGFTSETGVIFGVPWGGRNGEQLFSGGLDSQIVAWDTGSVARMLTLRGPRFPVGELTDRYGPVILGVTPLQFGGPPRPERLQVLNTATGVLHLWPLRLPVTDRFTGAIADQGGDEVALTFDNPKGRAHCQLRSLHTGRVLAEFSPTHAPVPRVYCALSPDDRTLVATLGGGRLRDYALPSLSVRRTVRVRLGTPSASRTAILPWNFAPDGSLVVYGADPGPSEQPSGADAAGSSVPPTPTNNVLALVDPVTGQVEHEVGLGAEGLDDVQWSPGGDRVVLALDSGRIQLLDGHTLKPVAESGFAASGFVLTANFSPDGSMVVAAGTDGTMTFWDGHTLQRIGQVQVGSDWTQAFYATPTGRILGFAAVGRGEQRVMSFPGDPSVWVRTACRVADSHLTPREWSTYVGDLPYRPICTRA